VRVRVSDGKWRRTAIEAEELAASRWLIVDLRRKRKERGIGEEKRCIAALFEDDEPGPLLLLLLLLMIIIGDEERVTRDIAGIC
jgi:hypothetical protein